MKRITRRTLLKNSALAAIGSSLYFSLPRRVFGMGEETDLTKVVLIRDENVIRDGKVDKATLEKMLNRALIELTGEADIESAWRSILKPDDVLGIKTNVWNNLRTPVELEELMVERAMEVGIKREDISVDDRGINKNEVFQRATALINARPMRTHAWSGVGSLLKNYIMFSPRPSEYHGDSCADLAKLWFLPEVKGKTRLNVLLMLTPLFHGVGPHHFNKAYTWDYKGMIIGFDPVAVDSVGLRILQAKRFDHFGEESPLNPPAKHIMLADTRHHLGTANPEKIRLVSLGWKEGLLLPEA
ncbi:MAG: DUF362 domain-containing protein [Bacteroidales bacterium]|nr:DUF362 domain-containing protein [Bacteroidales bacterium]